MTNALDRPEVARTLERLHRAARADLGRILKVAPFVVPDFFGLRKTIDARLSQRMRDTYLPVTRSQGQLLYLVARALGARRIVELGTSFGVSTTYLAAAVSDNGGGLVIGTENEPSKHARAVENLRAAGLDAFVDVRLGDAFETLRHVGGPIDLVLLDGWKDGYLPMVKMLTPSLRTGAVVFADNIFTFDKTLRPYLAHMRSPTSGFVSGTIDMADGFELSVHTGDGIASRR